MLYAKPRKYALLLPLCDVSVSSKPPFLQDVTATTACRLARGGEKYDTKVRSRCIA